MYGSNSQKLKILLGHISLLGQIPVHHADSDIESFRLHLELIVHLYQVINKVAPLLPVYFTLVLHEILGILQSFFFPEKVFVDLGSEFSY